jgi:serine/threonine protein phosphatase PrpC
MQRYILDVAGLSDRGVKRDHNEDAWSSPSEDLTANQLALKGRLFIVADGVGGHLAGDVASEMAVDIIQERYYGDPSPDITTSLQRAIQAANQQIDQESAAHVERRGMSTTVTAVVLLGQRLIVANVGDSRTYLIRKGHAHQVTSDHTWVEEQVRVGLITREEAAKHPQRNIITRSLGGNQKLEVDIFEEMMESGDGVLLCSDGLSNMVSREEISNITSQSSKAETAVRELVELAKERGAPDNVTAVLLRLGRSRRRGLAQLLLSVGVVAGLALIIGGVAWSMLGQNQQGPETPAVGVEATASPVPNPSPQPSLSPSAVTLPNAPSLVWPAESVTLVSGEAITFAWEWDGEPGDGKFTFVLQASEATRPLVHEDFALDQKQFVLLRSLTPGQYRWTMFVSRGGVVGPSVGRMLVVVEPTPTLSAPD